MNLNKTPKKIICENGVIEYRLNDGLLHREDGPAITAPNGYTEWQIDGKLHREDGPAVVYSNGGQHWYKNGRLHREDGPAIIYSNGTIEYWLNGERIDPLIYALKSYEQ